ncbi:hypothetical protein [Glycomyces dulcitolivorans]|uniref:hypothetical protein n=1 Tax=Glycomyces dulcitolivorans TaxID=2200759 RepID=UPI000DD463D4|nr:hypothetical protein [Glycomyces dulcitolivorans]
MTHFEPTQPHLPRQRSAEPDLGEVFDAVRERRVTSDHSRVISHRYPNLGTLTNHEWSRLTEAMDTVDTEIGDGAEALGRIIRVADDFGAGLDFLRFLLDMLRSETGREDR